MQDVLYDRFERPLDVGDIVVASRPSGNNSSEVTLCRVHKIRDKTVSLRLLNLDYTDKEPARWEAPIFTCNKASNDICKKLFLLQKV